MSCSISVPHHFKGSKFLQDVHYKSDEWEELYSRTRQTMEGFNGYVKHGAKGQLKDLTRRLVRGFTAQLFVIAFLVMNANLLLIDSWLLRPAGPPVFRGPRRPDSLAPATVEISTRTLKQSTTNHRRRTIRQTSSTTNMT